MAYISDTSLDLSLEDIRSNTEELHICSQEPTTVVEAMTTYSLGKKTSPTVNAPSDRAGGGGGRECVVQSFVDGIVETTGTATHWALVKSSATSRLLATGTLTPSQVVTDGNAFTLGAFAFGVTDAINV